MPVFNVRLPAKRFSSDQKRYLADALNSVTRLVRRAMGAATSGSCSEKVCFSHPALPQRHRLI